MVLGMTHSKLDAEKDAMRHDEDDRNWQRALRTVANRLKLPVEEVEATANRHLAYHRPQVTQRRLTTPAERLNMPDAKG